MFDEILRDVSDIGSDWQVTVRHDGPLDGVGLSVDMNDASGQDAATRVINEHVRQRFPDLWKNYEMKL